MTNVSRVGRAGHITPVNRQKLKQDAPQKGIVYSNVFRSEGDPEETIQAILYFAKKQIDDKQEKEGKGKKKKKQEKKKNKPEEKKFDENKTYVISSPVAETMQQPRKNGCAPTCLAMLLRKYSLVKSVEEGYSKVESLRGQGVSHLNDTGMSLENISRYAQMLDLKARVQRGENFLFQLEGLLRTLNRGATPIVSVQLPGMGTMRHAVLVIGISNKNVTIIDPAKIEVQEVSLSDFQQMWSKQEQAQYGVALAYVEVWGPKPQGTVKEHMDWMDVFEEFTRDKLSISQIYRSSGIVPVITLFPELDEEPQPEISNVNKLL